MIKDKQTMVAEAQAQINCIDAKQAKKLYEQAKDAVILDVRESDTASQSKLRNSINISRGLLEMKIQQACDKQDALILIHCGGGGRASLAALTLKSIGYTNVYAITEKYDTIKKEFE